jgi:hypothetical protein
VTGNDCTKPSARRFRLYCTLLRCPGLFYGSLHHIFTHYFYAMELKPCKRDDMAGERVFLYRAICCNYRVQGDLWFPGRSEKFAWICKPFLEGKGKASSTAPFLCPSICRHNVNPIKGKGDTHVLCLYGRLEHSVFLIDIWSVKLDIVYAHLHSHVHIIWIIWPDPYVKRKNVLSESLCQVYQQFFLLIDAR